MLRIERQKRPHWHLFCRGVSPDPRRIERCAQGAEPLLCESAAQTVPASSALIRGQKYQPNPQEWNLGDADTGWACLRTSVATPIYYMYSYESMGTLNPAVAGDAFVATAQGDLDGDSLLSSFSLEGQIRTGASGELAMVLATTVREQNADE